MTFSYIDPNEAERVNLIQSGVMSSWTNIRSDNSFTATTDANGRYTVTFAPTYDLICLGVSVTMVFGSTHTWVPTLYAVFRDIFIPEFRIGSSGAPLATTSVTISYVAIGR